MWTRRLLRVDPRRGGLISATGAVVAYPTDTLYGLAVDPRNAAAVRRLYELKGRAEGSALPLIAADLAQAERRAGFDDRARAAGGARGGRGR